MFVYAIPKQEERGNEDRSRSRDYVKADDRYCNACGSVTSSI